MKAEGRSQKNTKLNAGDVFVARLPEGRYKAVRVLRVCDKSSLVCTCAYLADEPPSINEPLLRETVLEDRFFFRNEPARNWLDGTPPKAFDLIGTPRLMPATWVSIPTATNPLPFRPMASFTHGAWSWRMAGSSTKQYWKSPR